MHIPESIGLRSIPIGGTTQPPPCNTMEIKERSETHVEKKNKNKTHKQRGNPINPKHIKQIDLLMKSLIINERCKSNLVINDFGQR